ncbi:hypothetical protein Ptr902_11769 [Pyrenophora tritici-repentis]|nr:hypothetical protein Ptr902_11769 [Pyrenophora tritici-repentis]
MSGILVRSARERMKSKGLRIRAYSRTAITSTIGFVDPWVPMRNVTE